VECRIEATQAKALSHHESHSRPCDLHARGCLDRHGSQTYKAEDGSTAAWTENDLGQRVTVRSPERIKQIADHEASVAKYKQR